MFNEEFLSTYLFWFSSKQSIIDDGYDWFTIVLDWLLETKTCSFLYRQDKKSLRTVGRLWKKDQFKENMRWVQGWWKLHFYPSWFLIQLYTSRTFVVSLFFSHQTWDCLKSCQGLNWVESFFLQPVKINTSVFVTSLPNTKATAS